MKKYLFTLAAAAALLMTGCNDHDKEPSLSGNQDESIAIPEDMEIAFPDPNFRSYVLSKFDTDHDGRISTEEAASEAVAVMIVDDANIYSLEGIQYFIHLKDLYCYGNQLTSLDLSKNTALTRLECGLNQLTSLDVSNSTVLEWLDCNNNQLTSLDVSKNTALVELNFTANQLTSLDVSQNTALTQLWCGGNQLTSLDVSNNSVLESLNCNFNQLTSLDVSNNTALTKLYCDDNQLTSLDVSQNTALEVLYCGKNQLTSLDVSKTSIGNVRNGVLQCYMPSLEVLYLKQDWNINGINNNRSNLLIHPDTRIEYKE